MTIFIAGREGRKAGGVDRCKALRWRVYLLSLSAEICCFETASTVKHKREGKAAHHCQTRYNAQVCGTQSPKAGLHFLPRLLELVEPQHCGNRGCVLGEAGVGGR